MLSKQKIKLVSSLKTKKYRDELGLFIAEGDKNVCDLSQKFRCEMLFATEEWLKKNNTGCKFALAKEQIFSVKTSEELKHVSFLTTPQEIVAVFQKPAFKQITQEYLQNELVFALDCIQNTGNLGTIIRIADWFGISKIACSKDTADVFNPKAVQAAMGALANVDVHYVNLHEFIVNAKENGIEIFGTFLNGKNIYTETLSKNGIIVFGSEGNGISPKIESLIPNRLYIPNFSKNANKSESLNVATAAAVICSEFRRRI
ncbi:MAG: RNA methyltransferase [Prevotellaceae bacterium]|jgi:TrmH family RNA methyltransferase|nr:RNA methyltransferase [Prevotellaceae bacterium]